MDDSIVMSTLASAPLNTDVLDRSILGPVLAMFANGYHSHRAIIRVPSKSPQTPTLLVNDTLAFKSKPDAIIFSASVFAEEEGTIQLVRMETPTPLASNERFILNYFLHGVVTSLNSSSILLDVNNILKTPSHVGKRRMPTHLYSDRLRQLEKSKLQVAVEGTMYVLIGSQNKFELGSMVDSNTVDITGSSNVALSIPPVLRDVVAVAHLRAPVQQSTTASAPSMKKHIVVSSYDASSYVQWLKERKEDRTLTYKEFLAQHTRKK